jgi:hypothetical protein
MLSRLSRYAVAVAIMAAMAFGFPMWNGDEWVVYHVHDLENYGRLLVFLILTAAAIGLTIHAAQEAQRVKTSEREANKDIVKQSHS